MEDVMTIYDHIELGRALKKMQGDVINMSKFVKNVPKKYSKEIFKLNSTLSKAKSDMEDYMFKHYPDSRLSVYYK